MAVRSGCVVTGVGCSVTRPSELVAVRSGCVVTGSGCEVAGVVCSMIMPVFQEE